MLCKASYALNLLNGLVLSIDCNNFNNSGEHLISLYEIIDWVFNNSYS